MKIYYACAAVSVLILAAFLLLAYGVACMLGDRDGAASILRTVDDLGANA